MPRKKKKRRLNTAALLFGTVMLISTAVIMYYWGRPRFIYYPDFGIDIPVNYSVHGIDVSRYQRNINWQLVKQMKVHEVGIQFCFIKATEGTSDEDPRFGRNWRQAGEMGIPRGAYHYLIPSADARLQARHFIRQVDLEPGDLPPVLDVEQTGGLNRAQLQEKVGDWLEMTEQHYGVKPVIYTGADFYARYLAGRFDDYPLWVAHYLVKDKPRVKRGWTFWQHSESGRVNGIEGPVDFNVFNGNRMDLEKLLIK